MLNWINIVQLSINIHLWIYIFCTSFGNICQHGALPLMLDIWYLPTMIPFNDSTAAVKMTVLCRNRGNDGGVQAKSYWKKYEQVLFSYYLEHFPGRTSAETKWQFWEDWERGHWCGCPKISQSVRNVPGENTPVHRDGRQMLNHYTLVSYHSQSLLDSFCLFHQMVHSSTPAGEFS